MPRSSVIAAAAATISSVALSSHAATIQASDPLNVASLSAGESFQLVFVTSTKTNPDDLDGTDDGTDNTVSADWNNYVNLIADSSSLQGVPDLVWSAIVSIQDKTADPADPGVAASVNAPALGDVYRTDGTLVATQANFYSSTHLAPIKWNENGAEQNTNGGSGSGRLVWTGSTGSGGIDSRPLGNPGSNTGNFSTRTGNAESTNDDWINTSDATRRGPTTNLRVYGLSELITIVPEPSSLALLGLGALCFARRRRG